MIENEILDEVRAAIPLTFHLSFKSQADEAVADIFKRAKANGFTKQQIGMSLYPLLETAFVRAGNESGLNSLHQETDPRGGTYAILSAKRIVVGRHTGPFSRFIPSRRSKFRRQLAAGNPYGDKQLNLLDESRAVIPRGSIYLSYLIVPDLKTGSGCSHVALGAYTPDFCDWSVYWPFDALVQAYAPEETIVDKAVATVEDRAQPRRKQTKN